MLSGGVITKLFFLSQVVGFQANGIEIIIPCRFWNDRPMGKLPLKGSNCMFSIARDSGIYASLATPRAEPPLHCGRLSLAGFGIWPAFRKLHWWLRWGLSYIRPVPIKQKIVQIMLKMQKYNPSTRFRPIARFLILASDPFRFFGPCRIFSPGYRRYRKIVFAQFPIFCIV